MYNAGKDRNKKVLSYLVNGNIGWYSHLDQDFKCMLHWKFNLRDIKGCLNEPIHCTIVYSREKKKPGKVSVYN